MTPAADLNYTGGCPVRSEDQARDVLLVRAYKEAIHPTTAFALPKVKVSRPRSWVGYHRRLTAAMKVHGIVDPFNALNAAVYTGVDASVVCTSLLLESAGGLNIWGHDPGGTALPGRLQGTPVTESDWRAYWYHVQLGWGNQGCGGMQLTSTGLQQLAQDLGGCYRSGPNFKVGAIFMRQLLAAHSDDVALAYQSYNGSGSAAEAYGRRAAALEVQLHTAFVAVR